MSRCRSGGRLVGDRFVIGVTLGTLLWLAMMSQGVRTGNSNPPRSAPPTGRRMTCPAFPRAGSLRRRERFQICRDSRSVGRGQVRCSLDDIAHARADDIAVGFDAGLQEIRDVGLAPAA